MVGQVTIKKASYTFDIISRHTHALIYTRSIIPRFSYVEICSFLLYILFFVCCSVSNFFDATYDDPANTSCGLLTVDRHHVFMVSDKTLGARLLTLMVSVGLCCLATWMGDGVVEESNSTCQPLVIISNSRIYFWRTTTEEVIGDTSASLLCHIETMPTVLRKTRMWTVWWCAKVLSFGKFDETWGISHVIHIQIYILSEYYYWPFC